MKKNIDEMNWRNAFRDTPADCHEAAMQAARSVQEHPSVHRSSYRLRPILIAVLMTLAMSSVAIAAGKSLGWFDYLDRYGKRGIPQTAVNAMQTLDGEVWRIGPLDFTLQELLADKYMALSTITVSSDKNGQALLCAEPFDCLGTTSSGEALARRLDLDPETTWIEAAAALNRPLYSVRAIFDMDPAYMGVGAMEDVLQNDDGSVSFFNQAMLNPDTVPEELPVHFFLQVMQFDPATGEVVEQWTDEEQSVTLHIEGVLEERTYHPQDGNTLNGYALDSIHAKRYATGTYLHIRFIAPDGADRNQCPELYDVIVMDGAGLTLPNGIYLSEGFDLSAWPQISVTKMIGVDTLPEIIQIGDGINTITLK